MKPGNPYYINGFSLDNAFETHSTNPWFPYDVPATNSFFRFVQKVRDLGIVTTSGYFGLNDPITRGTMSYYIVRGVLDEYPPLTGLTSNPKLASGAAVHGNAGFVPFDHYFASNTAPLFNTCSSLLTVQQCVQRYVENLHKQGVSELRFFFGVMGGGGSTPFDANFNVQGAWLQRLDAFFSDLATAGITQVSVNPALPGVPGEEIVYNATVQDCNGNYVNSYFYRTAPWAYYPQGNGLYPDNRYPAFSYQCSPANPYFVGWDKIYNLMDQVVKKALSRGLAVYEIDTFTEMNLEDFTIQARFVYDNKHGTYGTPCEVGGVWQNSPTVLQCFRRVLEINGVSNYGATISVSEARTSDGGGPEGDCTSPYGDSARVVGLSGLNAAIWGGSVGRAGRIVGGLDCQTTPNGPQDYLGYAPQPQPGLIDLHSYVCLLTSDYIDCDLTKTGSLLIREFRYLSDGISNFRNSHWPAAGIVFGETLNDDVLNQPGHQGDVQCLVIPSDASVDMVTGFNTSSLAGQSVAFRPFAILGADRNCVPWPPLWNKGNGPYATQ